MFPFLSQPAVIVVACIAGALLLSTQLAFAHCDTMDGPVVADARQALAQGDVTPVLKWTTPEYEQEIRDAFARTLAVRALSPEARELADGYFFETLVRLHRAGEGAPYTGLKPSGTQLSPAVTGADKALETGSIDALDGLLLGLIKAGIDERFAKALAAKPHAAESVAAGREYVEAYVQFVHYVERLETDASATGEGAHGEAGEEAEAGAHSAHAH